MTWPGQLHFGPDWASYRGEMPEHAPHRHAAAQVAVALSGELVCETTTAHVISPAVVIAPDALHRMEASRDVLSLYLEPRSLHWRRLASRYTDAITGDPALGEAVRQAINAQAAGPCGMAAIGALAGPATRPPDARLTAYLDQIDRGEPSHSDLSASQLRRLMRQEFGMTFGRYLRWRRLMQALRRIAVGDDLVAAAYRAGFSDQAHFARTLRATFGLRARDLRGALRLATYGDGALGDALYGDGSVP